MIVPILKITAKIIIILTLLMVCISGALVWYLADNIVQPPRRDLQDYHHYWLQQADKERIVVTSFNCASGDMPCLFVTPKPNARLGTRGQTIRTQLENDFGRTLLPYDVTANAPKGIVVLLHGRVGRKEDLLPVAARLVASGFICVLPDMPAHGDSPLTHSRFGTELIENKANINTANLIRQSMQDIRVWMDKNHKADNVDWQTQALPAFIWGLSMGGSYANYAAFESSSEWKGVIIVSSFAELQGIVDKQAQSFVAPLPDSLQSVAKAALTSLFALFVDGQGGTRPSDINPAKAAHRIDLPVLQFHGDKDNVIDINQGKRLFNSYASLDKTWITVEGAGHNDILITDDPVYATMADWLLTHSEEYKDSIMHSKH